MTLSTVSKDGRPHTAILLYTADDDFSIYFITHTDSKKTNNIAQNKFVSLAIWDIKKMSLQIEGEAAPVTDRQKQEDVIERILASNVVRKDFWPPMLSIKGQAYTVFKIKPNSILRFDLTQGHNSNEVPMTKIDLSTE